MGNIGSRGEGMTSGDGRREERRAIYLLILIAGPEALSDCWPVHAFLSFNYGRLTE